jgi:uncharacterized protein YbaP (TraB family)
LRFIAVPLALVFAATSSASQAATDPCIELAALRASPPTWIATNGDSKLTLIAVIHAIPPQTVWRSAALDQSIRSADELILDSVSNPKETSSALAGRAFSANLPPIRSRVPAELQPALVEAAQRAKMPLAAFDKMKTSAVSLIVGGTNKGSCKLGPSFQLKQEFEQGNRKVTALQTFERVLADFDALPESTQRELLEQALKPATGEPLRAMLSYWAVGDLDRSAAAAEAELGKSSPVVAMLSQEKARLGAALVQHMVASPGTKIVALGALYFMGPNSVLDQLKRQGFKVRRVQ